MNKLIIAIIIIMAENSFAQYGGILAGIEFSKPLFSDYMDAKAGFILGFFYNDIIDSNQSNYQLEFTLNQYRNYLISKYSGAENSSSIEILNTFLTVEAAILFEIPEVFQKNFPNFLLGFTVGYCVEDDHSSKVIGEAREVYQTITSYERSPLPIIFGINAGLSYNLNPAILGLRYKLSNIILDNRNFMQDIFIVMNLKL